MSDLESRFNEAQRYFYDNIDCGDGLARMSFGELDWLMERIGLVDSATIDYEAAAEVLQSDESMTSWLMWATTIVVAAVKDQTEAMPQPVQGGGAESSTPAPPVSHRHLFCTNHQSMAPVELNRCKEAYYRKYSAYGQPCSLYPIESLILGDPAVKGET